MNWVQIRIEATQPSREALEDALLETGALSITLEDAADQPILEPDLDQTPFWDDLILTALFDAHVDGEQVLAHLENTLPFPLPAAKVEILEDKDWIKAWEENYQPIQMTDKLWICPSWKTPPVANAINLMLDPGLAFGTGTHPTTSLCLKAIGNMDLTGKTFIDFGCGSGILAIAALLLGAKQGTAVDHDPQAVRSTECNSEKNSILANQLRIGLSTELALAPCDIMLANILASPLISLADQLASLTKPSGTLILSGLLADQQAAVIAAYPQVNFHTVQQEGDWICLIGTKFAP
ncbi:MAG: 50S ribosomal protein L11 methyltransferase [Cellvibrionales bacterium]|nr:50S ribosomal protein L11 methyltransferase [Cellvibrionales bacterium]